MKNGHFLAAGLLCLFFILVFMVSLAHNPHYPVLVIVGESSVGTWMSGVLLTISATVSLINGLIKNKIRWFLLSAFFFVLALDERFMFHEQLKEYLIFSFNVLNFWIYELPVLAGAFVGIFATLLLWNFLKGLNRVFLIAAVVLGIASVVFDIFTKGVLPEECFKLLGELLLTCSLLRMTEQELHISKVD